MRRVSARNVRWLAVLLLAGSLASVSEAVTDNLPFNLDRSSDFCPGGGQATLFGNIQVTPSSPLAFSFQGLATLQFSSPTNNLADCVGYLGPGLVLSGSASIAVVDGFATFSSDLKLLAFGAICTARTNTLGIYRRGPGGGLQLVQDVSFLNLGAVSCPQVFGPAWG